MLLKQGSVLVYAPQGLCDVLKAQAPDLVLIDDNVVPQSLRELDKPPYKLFVATDSFGMRGIDYRSKCNPMFLVVAQQFPCTREALQGVARVGRLIR